MNYGKAIRTARSIADRSQEDLAKEASINRSYLSSIESGRRTPSLDTLEGITRALKLPMHLLQLLGLEKKDIAPNHEAHVTSLAVELTKLLLQEHGDEPGRDSTVAGDAKSTAYKKLARSRDEIGDKQDNPTKAGRRNSGSIRAVRAAKKTKTISTIKPKR